MTSMPCLIMQFKPYIVELPPTNEADFLKICSTNTIYALYMLSPDRMKASVSAYQSVRGTSSTSQNTPQISYAGALRASARGTGEASYIVSGASEPG